MFVKKKKVNKNVKIIEKNKWYELAYNKQWMIMFIWV